MDSKKLQSKAKDRKKQMALTVVWLDENYCHCEGVCLPRCILYSHYLDFCRQKKLEPSCAATFGKIIRQKFPELTTRRLGTRGHSKYHYYGIGIKETSQYYHTVFSGKGLTRFSDCKLPENGDSRPMFNLTSKIGTILPAFPMAKSLVLPYDLPAEKFQSFIHMYRTHCQCILDTVIQSAFEEVHTFILHFWQGLPDHLLPLLNYDIVLDVIGMCDSILYKVLIDVLIPFELQEMADGLLMEIRNLAKYLFTWIESSIENHTKGLGDRKLPLAKTFTQSLKRMTSFLYLTQTCRPLFELNVMYQIALDFKDIDVSGEDNLVEIDAKNECDSVSYFEVLSEIRYLVTKDLSVKSLIQNLDEFVNQRIIKPSRQCSKLLRKRSQDFLLKWSFAGARITQSLTMNNSPSFASFHVIKMMIEEYLLLIFETQIQKEAEKEQQLLLQKYTRYDSSNCTMSHHASTCFIAPKTGIREDAYSWGYNSEISNGYISADSSFSSKNHTDEKIHHYEIGHPYNGENRYNHCDYSEHTNQQLYQMHSTNQFQHQESYNGMGNNPWFENNPDYNVPIYMHHSE